MKTKISYEKLHTAAKDRANTKRLSDKEVGRRLLKVGLSFLSYAMHYYRINILMFLD